MTASTFANFLSSLKETTSLNKKRKILRANAHLEYCKEFFIACLDSNMKFGISGSSLPETINNNVHNELFRWEKIKTVYTRFLTNKKNKQEYLNDVLQDFSNTELDVLRRIFNKDPSCGVSIALVNEVWPGELSPGVKLCKASSFSEKNLSNIKFPAIAQLKADGARCLVFCGPEYSYAYSSSGKPFQGMEHVFHALHEHIQELANYVLDGELVVLDDNDDIMPRKIGNGILNKSIKNTISKEEASRVRFFVWDVIPIEEYNESIKPKMKYIDRLAVLNKFVDGDIIRMIPTKIVENKKEAHELYLKYLKAGEEGIILKDKNSLWENKRSKKQVKYKADLECTLRVIDWEYGAKGTKYENCLGHLRCVSSDNIVEVNVGSGLSDEFRNAFMTQEKKTDFFIEVRFNALIESNGKYSLYLPRMTGLRFDKTEADDINTIRGLIDMSNHLA